MFVWSEQRGNDHFWSYKASEILCSFFCFPQLCLFPKEEFRGQLVLFCKYQSHGSGEMLCGLFVWVSLCCFVCSNGAIFIPSICKHLLSSSWCFLMVKKTKIKLSDSLVISNYKVLLPLLWRKRSLISQFKYFSVCGDSYRKKKVFQ